MVYGVLNVGMGMYYFYVLLGFGGFDYDVFLDDMVVIDCIDFIEVDF